MLETIMLMLAEGWPEILTGICTLVAIIIFKPKTAEQMKAIKEKVKEKLIKKANKLTAKLEKTTIKLDEIEKGEGNVTSN